MSKDEKVFTVAETAERLRVHQKTVRRYLTSGRLRGLKLGASPGTPGQIPWRVPESAISEFLGIGSKELTGAN